jgi:hypothetical protein
MNPRISKALASIAAVTCVSGLLAGAALAGKASFKTGTYRGTTSQGMKFVAKILTTPECDDGKVECFFTITQPELKTTCPDGESNEYEDFGFIKISPSGVVKQTLTSSDGTKESLSMKISRNGTISGSFRVTHEPDSIDPEEATGYCSGSATFKLKRG